jgi:hypothetical protein
MCHSGGGSKRDDGYGPAFPFRVKLRSGVASAESPLYPAQRTSIGSVQKS